MDDTIAAIATAPGVGAISVIRVSGGEAELVVSKCFSKANRLVAQPRLATLGTIRNENGEPIDEVLATYFPAPASFTGEHVIEITGHGGLFVTQSVLNRILACGARGAEGGEFTQRAFLNGKLDLTQAEGIMDIISAQSDLALRAAQNQLHGSIQSVTNDLRDALINVTSHLEAYIDFPEDDIDPETGNQLTDKLRSMTETCQKLLSTSHTGKLLREGARVVICGEPNAGKSSLLNRLLGYERALVSDIKGTTRDTVEEVVNVDGLPIRFIDTAGLRDTEEIIEKQGIERAEREMETADLIVEVIDGTLSPSEVVRPTIPKGVRHLVVLNKSDEGIHTDWDETCQISCTQDRGLLDLPKQISAQLLDGQTLTGSSLIAINARHQTCLRVLTQSLEKAKDEIESAEDPELVALTMREALGAIGELTGRVDTEEILGQIFAQFCIGK